MICSGGVGRCNAIFTLYKNTRLSETVSEKNICPIDRKGNYFLPFIECNSLSLGFLVNRQKIMLDDISTIWRSVKVCAGDRKKRVLKCDDTSKRVGKEETNGTVRLMELFYDFCY